jgi:hypothetical protein
MSQKRLLILWATVGLALFAAAIFTPKDHEFAAQIVFLSSTILRKLCVM